MIRTFCSSLTWSMSEIRTVTFIIQSPVMGSLSESVPQ
ncbi:hypothetical protein SALBM311S_08089 [Streptomyces alboniger]